MSDNMPFELQEEIIKRLPVKSLIQFRSVSKAWKSLIDSREFIASHSLRHTQPQRLLVRYNDPVTIEENYVSFVDDDTFPQQKIVLTVPLSIELLIDSRIIGSSNGLMCLYGYYKKPGDYPRHKFKTEMVVLWNPSIRKSIAIVLPNVLYGSFTTDVGFGVCPVTCDPKMVEISHVYKPWDTNSKIAKPWKVNVYTLSSGKWRSLSSNLPRDSIEVTCSQIVIDRFIYWFAVDQNHRIASGEFGTYYLIVSFDLTTEEFREVELPDTLACQPGRKSSLTISKVWERLAVLEYYISDDDKCLCDVWKMEDGVWKSFTKLFTVNTPHAFINTVLGFRKKGEPIMVTQDDFEVPGALVVYEPFSEHINDLEIIGSDASFFVNSYTETLLLLDQSNRR